MQMLLCNGDISLGAVSEMTIDECPNLGLFYNAYQLGAVNWMLEQLGVINIVANVSNKLNDTQMNILASDIIREYPYLNLADICIFLGRLRRGKYGKFFNAVDNMQIMTSLQEFVKERYKEIDLYERRKNERALEAQRKEWAKSAITYEEYVKRRNAELAEKGESIPEEIKLNEIIKKI